MSHLISYLLLLVFIALPACGLANSQESQAQQQQYQIQYTAKIVPEDRAAHVVISIPDAKLVKQINFNLDNERHSDVTANGELQLENGRAIWTPPKKDAQLNLKVSLVYERDPGEYDAMITDKWTLFRGDDLIPPAKVRAARGATSDASLVFQLPENWPSVNSGWERSGPNSFVIDNPERRFDRPTGWMIAGQLGTRRDQIGSTQIAISAPRDSDFRRMDMLTFLNMVFPQVEQAFQQVPPKLLLVGAGDPMWRGGLSAPNSLYLHKDRPLVSENGTSPLVHELVHMVTGIVGAPQHDWIAEGLAEFYSVELLHRAGALNEDRRRKIFDGLAEWGEDVDTLIKRHSTGKTSARAAVLFEQLDQEIRQHSDHNLDRLVRRLLQVEGKAGLDDIRQHCKELLGRDCKTLNTALLDES